MSDAVNIRVTPRVRLKVHDSMIEKYPCKPAVGHMLPSLVPVVFDDTKTIVFQGNVTVNYPSVLPLGSPALVDASSSLSATAIVRKGLFDFVDGGVVTSSISPFVEANDVLLLSDPFHMTGSEISDVGLGFSAPLRSKTRLVIDLTPVASQTFREFGTGASGTLSSFPMQYYNFERRMWEGVGLGFPTQAAISRTSALSHVIRGFDISQGVGNLAVSLSEPELPRVAANPVSDFGFPYEARYHATSSQQFCLSASLPGPFVIEKIVYQFSGALDPGEATSTFGTDDVAIASFFILNQRQPAVLDSTRLVQDGANFTVLTSTLPTSIVLTSGSTQSTFVDTIRDLVTFAQVTNIVPSNMTSETVTANSQRDLNISTPSLGWSGQFVLSASVKSAASSHDRFVFGVAGGMFNFSNWAGARSGLGNPVGRSLVGDVAGNTIDHAYALGGGVANLYLEYSSSNPYIIFPTDRLTFGWEVPHETNTSVAVNFGLTLFPRVGKLTLYGSLLKENVEFHDTLGQQLVSDAIHEDIDDGHVLDQFDVEPKFQFSGSMVSQFVSGSMTSDGAVTISGPRRKIADATQALTLGERSAIMTLSDNDETVRSTPPGFGRVLRASSEDERFFDTMMPPIDEMTRRNGGVVANIGSYNYVTFGHITAFDLSIPQIRDVDWNRSFPFEPRYAGLTRLADAAAFSVSDNGNVIRPLIINRTEQFNTSSENVLLSDNFSSPSITPPASRFTLLHAFGIGSFYTGSTNPAHVGGPADTRFVGALVRGFKYGVLCATPLFSSAVWRLGRYGHHRDMLEQRLDGKFFGAQSQDAPGVRTGPVLVSFINSDDPTVSDPYLTDSSNMSTEASSSLPYFDDVSRNR